MSLHKELEEYSNECIEQEYRRRVQCQLEDKCHYCGQSLDSYIPCKVHPHNGSYQD